MSQPTASLPSLRSFFRRQAIQWSLTGLGLTILIALPCVAYTIKIAAERQAAGVARTAAHVFRPQILEGRIRDAEILMPRALDLQKSESAIVRSPDMQAIYPFSDKDKAAHCSAQPGICWSNLFRTITVIHPIFFDEDSKEGLFGYLEVKLNTRLDWGIPLALGGLLLIVFFIQTFGLSAALRGAADSVSGSLDAWSKNLLHPAPDGVRPERLPPFKEFSTMHDSVNSLHGEIERLQERTAKEAKASAQAAILRQVGHDLRTPLSQLRKFLFVHFERVRSGLDLNEEEVSKIERALNRATDLIQQIKRIHGTEERSGSASFLSIAKESQTILSDLAHADEIMAKGIHIQQVIEDDVPLTAISKIGFYQILENLVRNAAQAVSRSDGEINIIVLTHQGRPMLTVKDNGPGIPPDIREWIFDFDFTTKPGQGAGLGLGIVRRICNEVGAEIRLDGNTGEGASFTVSFLPAPKASLASVFPLKEVQSHETPTL